MPDLSEHFVTDEGKCPCGCGLGERREDYPLETVYLLEDMRQIKGAPIGVNSWLRCPAHNAAVGGVPNSAHTRGTAVDARASCGAERYDLLALAFIAAIRAQHHIPGIDWSLLFLTIRDTLRGIGIAKTFVHIDTDRVLQRPAAWGYGPEGGGG